MPRHHNDQRRTATMAQTAADGVYCQGIGSRERGGAVVDGQRGNAAAGYRGRSETGAGAGWQAGYALNTTTPVKPFNAAAVTL